jgi:hypothetical protein
MSIDVVWICTFCGVRNSNTVYVSSDPIHTCVNCGKASVRQAQWHIERLAKHFAAGEVDVYTNQVVHLTHCFCGTELVGQICPLCESIVKEDV